MPAEFVLKLGSSEQLFLAVETIEGGKAKNVPLDGSLQLRDAFLRNIEEGARLADYVGIWLLPMDLLPSDPNQRQLPVHVFSTSQTLRICISGRIVVEGCRIESFVGVWALFFFFEFCNYLAFTSLSVPRCTVHRHMEI